MLLSLESYTYILFIFIHGVHIPLLFVGVFVCCYLCSVLVCTLTFFFFVFFFFFYLKLLFFVFFFFSSRRRHTRLVRDWSSDVCSSDL